MGACGSPSASSAAGESAAEEAVLEQVQATPEPTPAPAELDFSSMSDGDIESVTSEIKSTDSIRSITLNHEDGTSDVSLESFIAIAEAAPEGTPIDYTFSLFGQEINTLTTDRLEYKQTEIGDEGLESFRQVLPYLSNLNYLSFDRCGTTDEACAQLRDDFPDTEVVWRIYFGPFSAMTDVETIWASCDLRNETCGSLKYCTKLKNLDIGHCAMTDLSFLDYMPELDTLIISCSDFNDISHVASCKKLKYFEMAECQITDISPIAELTELEHLNIGGNTGIVDFSPLYNLKNLKRLYGDNIMNVTLDMEKISYVFRELMPETEISFEWCSDGALNGTNWRYSAGHYNGHYVSEYVRIREVFNYDAGMAGQARLYE